MSQIARRGDRVATALVTDRREAQQLTARADHDALTALRRGLAEYLLTAMQPDTPTGREVQLESVLWGWASFEQRGRFPAAYVGHEGAVVYRTTTTARGSSFRRADAGLPRLDVVADVTAALQVVVYAKDTAQRSALVMAAEQAMYPVDWLDGARVRLDCYHGAFATYDLTSVLYDDSTDAAQEAFYRAILTVNASLPLVVTRAAAAGAEGRAKLTTGPDVGA